MQHRLDWTSPFRETLIVNNAAPRATNRSLPGGSPRVRVGCDPYNFYYGSKVNIFYYQYKAIWEVTYHGICIFEKCGNKNQCIFNTNHHYLSFQKNAFVSVELQIFSTDSLLKMLDVLKRSRSPLSSGTKTIKMTLLIKHYQRFIILLHLFCKNAKTLVGRLLSVDFPYYLEWVDKE